MVLPRGLRRGAFVELGERDIRALMLAAGMTPPTESGKPVNHREERAKSRRRGNSVGPRPSYPKATEDKPRFADRLVQAPSKRRGAQAVNPKGSGGQPDPMKTSLGYIGADSFVQRPRGGGASGSGRKRRPG